MRALVTGASGFLGGRLAQVLAARDAEVRVLVRASNDLTHLAGSPVNTIHGSLTDWDALETAVRDVTHIFHCAAKSTDWASDRDYEEANVTGTENLLRAASQSKNIERFLHVSTTDVYGYPRTPCDEDGEVRDTGLPYNRTKLAGELAARASELPVTVVRPATIYGPRSVTFGSDIAVLLRQRLMAVIDGGRATGGFCYVDNAVDGILLAATIPEALGRVYNLADATGVTWRTYVDEMAKGLGTARAWIDMPAGAALAIAAAMEAPHRYLKVPGRPLLTRHVSGFIARTRSGVPGRTGASRTGFRACSAVS